MSVRRIPTTVAPHRLAAVLAAGQRHLTRTAVEWDNTRKWKSQTQKRLAREAWVMNTDPIEGVKLQVTVEEWKNAPPDMHFERLVVVVDGLYTVVAEFPIDYPFKPPYLKVRIEGGVLMDLKKYLTYATSNLDKSGPMPGHEAAYAHVRNDATMQKLALLDWGPALTMKGTLQWILADELLTSVLSESAVWNEDEEKVRDVAAAAALEDSKHM